MWHDHIWRVVIVKLDINALNFWHSGSNSIKVTFLDSYHQNLCNNVYFVWFCEGPHLLIFYNDIIMTSFRVTWFSNSHIL